MGTKRIGLARVEAMIEALDRDLDLTDATLSTAIIKPMAGQLHRGTPVILADADVTLTLATHGGRTNVMPDTSGGGERVLTLPTPTFAGEYYHFIYGGAAADTDNLSIKTTTSDGSVDIKGALAHLDTNADNVAVYSNGTSNDVLTITDTAFADIHFLASSTTLWYIWGYVISATAPAFSDS